MGLYSAKIRIAAPASGANLCEMRPGANRPMKIRLIKITAETAVATGGAIGLYRTTNVPTGATSTLGQPLNPGDANPTAAGALVTGSWTVAPVLAAVPIDGDFLGTVIGSKIIFPYNYGEEVVAGYDPTSTVANVIRSLVLHNDQGAALPALTIDVDWDE